MFSTETDPSYYRARYYDPQAGRFLNEDFIKFSGGNNFYTYVDNEPLDYEDPQGLKKYKCPLFGPCRQLSKKEQAQASCCSQRPPDFYNLSLSAGAPWGPIVSISIDRQWNTWVGPGVQYGKSPTILGGSLTANHLDSCRPTQKQLDNYLGGLNVSVTGAAGLALQQGVSPTSVASPTGHATGYGVGTPQIGVSGTFSVSLSTALNVLNAISNNALANAFSSVF